jgi:UPF0716 protein FxsA
MAYVSGGRPADGPRRRSGLRDAVLAALLLPVLELAVFLLLVRATSGWTAVGIVVLTSLLGAVVLSREVPRAWGQVRAALRVERLSQGRLPGVELLDGALVLLGGVLLLVPGIVSDVVGLLCVLPFTRPPLRRLLLVWVRRRAAGVAVRVRPPGGPGDRVVRGEVLDGPGSGKGPKAGPDTTAPRDSGTEAGRPVIEGRIVDGRGDPV